MATNGSIVRWPVVALLVTLALVAIGWLGQSKASVDRVDGIEKRVEKLERMADTVHENNALLHRLVDK